MLDKPLRLGWMIGGTLHHGPGQVIGDGLRVYLIWNDAKYPLCVPHWVCIRAYVHRWATFFHFNPKHWRIISENELSVHELNLTVEVVFDHKCRSDLPDPFVIRIPIWLLSCGIQGFLAESQVLDVFVIATKAGDRIYA